MTVHPSWIRTKWLEPGKINFIDGLLKKHRLHTVCRSAKCPNIGECFSRHHLTFIILGDVCTRNCRFCAVATGDPLALDLEESQRIAELVKVLGLKDVVITSVTRDDLIDGGADLFRQTIAILRNRFPDIAIEILTPDFNGNKLAIEIIMNSPPDVWAHNLETVPELYRTVRPQASYGMSLSVLEQIKLKSNDILTKSGIMLGLGEKPQAVLGVLDDLKSVAVDIVTLGQYLQPDKNCLKPDRYISPEDFKKYAEYAYQLGFKQVLSGPLVRSSYRSS